MHGNADVARVWFGVSRANPIIYTIEKHPVYGPLLQPLWRAAMAQTIEIVSSDLVLMETPNLPLSSWTIC